MKKGILDKLTLADPTETAEQRKSFCAKVVTARPTIEKLVDRLLLGVMREYFGKVRTPEQMEYLNGMVDFGEALKTQVVMFEGEQIEQNKPKEKDEPISSGSVLNL